MEIKYTIIILAVCASSCTTKLDITRDIQELYVDDFHSDEIYLCKTSDVELSHSQAREFFSRAREVNYKTIHDHYEIAPCYISGPVKYKNQPCSWKIRPGNTGSITCGEKVKYFVCDNCNNLLNQSK
jgi:hypothetical protein